MRSSRAVAAVLANGAARVGGINLTTRDTLADLIAEDHPQTRAVGIAVYGRDDRLGLVEARDQNAGSGARPDPAPYDAVLLVCFGGPEKPEDVKRIKAIQKDIHNHFIALVKERRGIKLKGTDKVLFSGEFLPSSAARGSW